MITHIRYAQENFGCLHTPSYTLPYFQLPDDFKNSPWRHIISIKQVALCANELIDLIDTPSKRLPSGKDCIHGGYVVVGNSEHNIKHRDCPLQDNIYMVDTWWAILSTLGIRIAQRAMLTSNHRKS